MKSKRIVKRVFLLLVILLISYVIYSATAIYLYAGVNELTKADAALVLGAGLLQDKPSPVFAERINHGIWLYENRYVDKIIFTGGISKNSEHSDSSIARKYAVEKGVPFADIYIEEQSTITQENIFHAAQIIKSNCFSTVIIVSDPLHMKRAMLMAKDCDLKAYSSPTPTTRYISLKTKLPFLARETFFYIGYQIFSLFFY